MNLEHNPANKSSLESRIFDGPDNLDKKELEALATEFPDLLRALEELTSSKISKEAYQETVQIFNQHHNLAPEGKPRSFRLSGIHGVVTVNKFENGSISILADYEGATH